MNLNDPLYGCFEVDEVLANLIRSRPVQRLKRIHQTGTVPLQDISVTRRHRTSFNSGRPRSLPETGRSSPWSLPFFR